MGTQKSSGDVIGSMKPMEVSDSDKSLHNFITVLLFMLFLAFMTMVDNNHKMP